MRLTPAEVSMVERLRREASGVFTVVMQDGNVRQVARRQMMLDEMPTNSVSFQQDEQGVSPMTLIRLSSD